ncbi:hypothetical protein C1H46_012786 [Malus baccata]|uniref:Uncharacterized protein n=1 Tax=Malus baccata TaxID=106549 RepID=A0A540MRY3_MALBA|nr:hypothetical protein C1H46_012786 [Malus baccata]
MLIMYGIVSSPAFGVSLASNVVNRPAASTCILKATMSPSAGTGPMPVRLCLVLDIL